MDKTCKTCRFGHQGEGLQCRRFPPFAQAVQVQNQITQEVKMAPATMWPVVQPGWWCGEWQQAESLLIPEPGAQH